MVCVCVCECFCGGKDLSRKELACGGVLIEKRNIFWPSISLYFIQIYFFGFLEDLFCCALTYYLSTNIFQGEKCIF